MNRRNHVAFVVAFVVVLPRLCSSYAPIVPVTTRATHWSDQLNMVSSKETPTTIQVKRCSGEETDIESVARFMVDAFWLQSPQQLVIAYEHEQDSSNGNQQTKASVVSDSTRATLLTEQTRDLMEKYGERLGKRLLPSCLLTAVTNDNDDLDRRDDDDSNDDNSMLGVVGVEVCLWDKTTNEIIGATKAETQIKNVVSSLGPKQRRQYKDCSVQELARELLPPQVQAICCLSNLCVSPHARRKGVANELCRAAQDTALEWGYNEMFLKVEVENEAARYLYENKLGYKQECVLEDQVAIRVDDAASGFVETSADTLILRKEL